ncbi:MAG: trypsin-like peptidase domain-containing protein [Oscillospiraceae bacterium]|nr:trypsin-like peptidase domain-containing protein [Oscillospiraceae bacterium]
MFEEVRENLQQPLPAEEPEEVVSWYVPRSKEGQEVISYYVQGKPLPGNARAAAAPEKKKPKRRRGLLIFLIALGVMLAVLVGALIIAAMNDDGAPEELPEDGDASSIVDIFQEEKTSIPTVKGDPNVRLEIRREHGEELTIQQVYAKVNPATVTVVADDAVGSSIGTGIIMTADGYIITNAHVIAGARSCWIALDTGVTYDAKLVGYDSQQDLAVLKAENAANLPVAEFGDSNAMTVGDTAYAIGNPLGLELRGTLTAGIISAVNRAVEMDGNQMTLLQTTAALNNGNSGGPLINVYGQVIGVNVMKMTSTDPENEAAVEGLGFALPISDMAYVANDLITYGYFRGMPTIGITVVTVDTGLGYTAVVAQSISAGSGAEEAGIQPGDIIAAADGVEIRTSDDLLAARQKHSVGDTMTLTILRGEEAFDVQITLYAANEMDD